MHYVFDFDWLATYWPVLLKGIGITVQLIAVGGVLGVCLGILCAWARALGPAWLKPVVATYVELIRNTPFMIQLFFIFFGLPAIGLQMSELAEANLAMVINLGAYSCEIIRAGIQAVDKGQTEAARSLGLNSRQAMVRVILPQAVKNILPALCNEFVSVIKETSLASTFFIGDIMSQYKIINGFTFLIIEPLLIAGIIYFIITFVLSKGIAVLERRMKASD